MELTRLGNSMAPETPGVAVGPKPGATGTPDVAAGGIELGRPVSADRLSIGPLDDAAALALLLTEISAALQLPVPAGARPQDVLQAAQLSIAMLLDAMPPDALGTLESQFQGALERGVEAVRAWPQVAPAVGDTVRAVRDLVTAQLKDDPPAPAWLRPEWQALAPAMRRFWRRRRRLRRGLHDPEPWPGSGENSRGDGAP